MRNKQVANLKCLGVGGSVISIDFPAMPEVLEFAREATYDVKSNLAIPDGLHFFKSVNPLSVPISFSLSAFDDEYNGSLGAANLVKLAANLHALVLPIRDDSGGAKAGSGSGQLAGATGASTPGFIDGVKDGFREFSGDTAPGGGPASNSAPSSTSSVAAAQANAEQTGAAVGAAASNIIPAFPAVCRMTLIQIGLDQPGSIWGVDLVGYVKAASAKFHGPWLFADDNSFNLPSYAEYSFTFVHAPGYRNKLTVPAAKQDIASLGKTFVFASDVGYNFYGNAWIQIGINSQQIQPVPDIRPNSVLASSAPPAAAAPVTLDLSNITGVGPITPATATVPFYLITPPTSATKRNTNP